MNLNSLEEVRKVLEEKGVLKPRTEKTAQELKREKYEEFKKSLPVEERKQYDILFDE